MIRIFFLLAILSGTVWSKTDIEILDEWTKINETKLVQKYPKIHSKWFETECLSLANNLQFKHINKCQIFNSEIVNAYVFNNGHVYFSLGMMQQIYNQHQWAAALAHENAHVVLQHYLKMLKKLKKPGVFFPKSKIKKMMKRHEAEADLWSEQQLKDKDMDYSQINYFFERVKTLKAHGKNTHLKLSKRIKHAKYPEIIDKELIKSIKEL